LTSPSLSQRVVFITGASGNLGAATARAFQRVGAHTVLVYRTADHLLLGGIDLADEASVAAALGSAVERFGRHACRRVWGLD